MCEVIVDIVKGQEPVKKLCKHLALVDFCANTRCGRNFIPRDHHSCLDYGGAAHACVRRRSYTQRSKSHYEALGIASKASQAEIKKAYYKLSMQYHPDKLKGDEDRFREINAAYEVLGNVKLRKLYDQGAISDRGRSASAEDLAKAPPSAPPPPQSHFYKTRVPTSGRTQVYNFDEWSRMHYQKARTREFEKRQRSVDYAAREREFARASQTEYALWGTALFFFAVALILGNSGRNYDRPSKPPPKDDS